MARTLAIVMRHEVRDAGDLVVRLRTAQRLLGDVFMGHGLDHVRPGDEHVTGFGGHQREVSDGWRVDRAARAGTENRRYLRHHSRRQRIAQEDVGVSRERDDALLNARAAGIVETDDGRADAHGHVHHFHNLCGICFR